MSTPIRREALSLNIPKNSYPLSQRPKGKIDRVCEPFFRDPARKSPSIDIPQKKPRLWGEQIDTSSSIAIPGIAAKTLSPSPQENMSISDSSFSVGTPRIASLVPATPPQPEIFHCELGSTPESEDETLPLREISSEQIPQRVFGRYATPKGKENVPPKQSTYYTSTSPATGKSEDFSFSGPQSAKKSFENLTEDPNYLQFPFEI